MQLIFNVIHFRWPSYEYLNRSKRRPEEIFNKLLLILIWLNDRLSNWWPVHVQLSELIQLFMCSNGRSIDRLSTSSNTYFKSYLTNSSGNDGISTTTTATTTTTGTATSLPRWTVKIDSMPFIATAWL